MFLVGVLAYRYGRALLRLARDNFLGLIVQWIVASVIDTKFLLDELGVG